MASCAVRFIQENNTKYGFIRKKGGGGGLMKRLRMKVTHNPMRELAVSTSLQCESFLSPSSSEWAIVEDSISLVVSDLKKKHLSKEVC